MTVLDSLDKGQEIISEFFDLSKAFDSVPRAPLVLQKFQSLVTFYYRLVASDSKGRYIPVVILCSKSGTPHINLISEGSDCLNLVQTSGS